MVPAAVEIHQFGVVPLMIKCTSKHLKSGVLGTAEGLSNGENWRSLHQSHSCNAGDYVAVLDDERRALHQLEEIAALRPAPDELERIEERLERLQKSLNLAAADFERWRAHLVRGQQ